MTYPSSEKAIMDHLEYLKRQGSKGGKARAANLSKRELREIALKGVWARTQKKVENKRLT